MNDSAHHLFDLTAGQGEVRALMRETDWSRSSLGEPAVWPRELRTIVNLMLNSKFPMFLAWGDELGFLYNDAYSHILADKHPQALGAPFKQVWREIWDIIVPIIDQAMSGVPAYYEDLPLMIQRKGYLESAWFTFSYSPLHDAGGTVAGMYCTVVETTAHVEARHAQTFELALSDRMRELTSADEIVAAASASLGTFLGLSRVNYCEVDDVRKSFLIRRDWNSAGTASLAGVTRRLDDFGPELVKQLRAGSPMAVHDTLAIPLIRAGKLAVVLSLHSAAPRQWSASELRIAGSMAERTWSAVERAGAQEALQDSNRRKDEFLAMLAHELRNPLAPISAAAELMELARLDSEGMRRTSAVIRRQVRHMTGLVDDLLDVSRVTRGQVTLNRVPQDMNTVVTHAVEQARPLIEARRHRLNIVLAPGSAQVVGDENRLVQVLANLLNNAAKYTPNGGQLEIAMELQDGQVAVHVQDDGIGIEPELQVRMFDLFSQAERTSDRSQGGLGLGLALVRSLVELHGGDVSGSSAGIGQGSRFTVRLPLAGPQAAIGERRALERDGVVTAHSVLVVDDNADAADMLGMLLEADGHAVTVVHGSQAALDALAASAPGVCILDIGLPDMDGYELARRIRAMDAMRSALLVAVTGYGQDSDRTKALAAGFDAHLVKPVDTGKLLQMLASRRRER
jgi:signal transduction histidine kinase/ActR/RegA family two-component response regulator